MKYKSELIKEIVETRGHNLSSPHYESECVKSWIEETKEAYPKLCDYESEWLNYIIEKTIGNVSYETVIVNPTATINNVVPYEYKSAILKGSTTDNILNFDRSLVIHNTVKDFSFLFPPKLNKKYVLEIELTDVTPVKGDSDYIAVRGVREDGNYYEITKLVQSFANGTYEIPITFNENYSKFRVGVAFKATIVNMKLKGELISVKMPVLTTTNEDGTKTNILTVNEDVTLRGIGDVRDELNCLTGEVVQRVGEIVLDGSEDETYNTVVTSFNGSSNTIIEFIPSENLVVGLGNNYTNAFLSNYNYNQFFNDNWITDTSALWGVYLGVTDNKTTIRIIVADGTTYAEVRQHLQENPLRIVCKLATPTIKTVALTPLNKPYKGTNHYHLTANIPCEAILEVPVVSTGKQTIE